MSGTDTTPDRPPVAAVDLALLETLLSGAPVGLAVWDSEGRYLRINETLADANGLAVEEHLGRRVEDVLPGTSSVVRPVLAEVLATGVPLTGVEISDDRGSATGRTWSTSWFPVVLEPGAERLVVVVAVETTGYRQAEAARSLAAERAAQMVRVTGALTAARTVQDVADAVLSEIPALVGACMSGIALHDASTNTLVHLDARADVPVPEAGRSPQPVESGASLGARAVLSGRPQLCGSLDELVAMLDVPDARAYAAATGQGAWAALPLRSDERTLGVLRLAWPTAREFPDDERRFLESVAAQCAQALDRVQLVAAERAAQLGTVRAAQRASRLLVLAQALARAATPAQVARAVTATAYPLLGAIGGGVSVIDADRRSVRVLASASGAVRREWRRVPLDSPMPGAVAARTGRRTDSTYDVLAQTYPAGAEFLAELGATDIVAVPLQAGRSVLGSMTLLYGPTSPVSAADDEFVSTVAVMAAQALERTQHAETARQGVVQVQRALLPRALPHVDDLEVAAAYRSPVSVASEVGGDFYDVIPIGPSSVVLVMGDVEGHDLAAAAVMAQVRSAIRTLALEGEPPAMVLRRTAQFLDGLAVDRLVTVGYVEVHLDGGFAVTVDAGHPPPLLVQPDGTSRFLDEVEPGPPLGVLDGLLWRETTIRLSEGDLLVLVTDGVIENRGESLDTGLAALARAAVRVREAAVGEVAESLLDVAGRSAEQEDDAAVLVARVRARRGAAGLGWSQRTVPARPVSARVVRWWAEDVLTSWGVEAELRADAQLLLSELLTNALRHSDAPVTVRLQQQEGALRVEVTDANQRLPLLRHAATDEPGGRGMWLVDALSDQWGVDEHDAGKTVWFCLALR